MCNNRSVLTSILADLEKQLGTKNLINTPVRFYTDGTTDATVFSVANQYVIKITDINTIRRQETFLRHVQHPAFQHFLCKNEALSYECFTYIHGMHYTTNLIDGTTLIAQIAEITKSYPPYSHLGYGFLGHEKTTWTEFLLDEINYAKMRLPKICPTKVITAWKAIPDQYCRPPQFLIHGDFGSHNFLVENHPHHPTIRVIDPMPLVGDPLYDFFFAISEPKIFHQVKPQQIFSIFNAPLQYQQTLFKIALYVRMSRATLYDRQNLPEYIELYQSLP